MAGDTWVACPSCPSCGRGGEIRLTDDELGSFRRWEEGEFIQRAFPRWSADRRELLMTGYHPTCWDQDFAEPEVCVVGHLRPAELPEDAACEACGLHYSEWKED